MKYGCRPPSGSRTHSYQPSAGTRQRRRENEPAYARLVATVSARALIMRAAPEADRDQCGSSPQRPTQRLRCPSGLTRTNGTGSVGATL